MQNKEKTMVYPFDYNFMPVLRNRDLLRQYVITKLVSPRGWGLEGKDAGTAFYDQSNGMVISSDFEEGLSAVSWVMFVDPGNAINFKKLIYPKMVNAIEAGKNILCHYRDIEEELLQQLREKSRAHSIQFISAPDQAAAEPFTSEVEYLKLLDIDTPVVSVLGFSERVNKFDTQLLLRSGLQTRGYKVSQIGSRDYCEILDFHSFPRFMYDTHLSEVSKIVLFNQFVKRIEKQERPDIIIIGVPGGVMPFNNQFTNRFGIMAYMLSQAVPPDTAILNCHFDNYNKEYFEKIRTTLKYKLGAELCCSVMPNVFFDFTASKEADKEIYLNVNSRLVDKMVEGLAGLDPPVFSLTANNSKAEITTCVIEHLAQYAAVASF